MAPVCNLIASSVSHGHEGIRRWCRQLLGLAISHNNFLSNSVVRQEDKEYLPACETDFLKMDLTEDTLSVCCRFFFTSNLLNPLVSDPPFAVLNTAITATIIILISNKFNML